MMIRARIRRWLALSAVAVVASAGALAASAQAGHPPASHLRSGEYCKKKYQSFYKRHGYICKRASDGKLRLFKYP